MLPYIYSRLKGKKIIIDPSFKNCLDPEFSNKILKSVYDREECKNSGFALPKSWN